MHSSHVVSSEGVERILRAQPLNPLEQPRIQLRDAPPGWQPAHPLLDHKLSPDEQAKALYALGLPTPEEATAEILRVRGEPVEVQKGPDQRPYTKPHATTVLDLTGNHFDPTNPAHLAVQHSATFFNQGDSPVNDTDA